MEGLCHQQRRTNLQMVGQLKQTCLTLIRHKPFNNIMLYVIFLLQILVTRNVVHVPPNIIILFSVNKKMISFYQHAICLKNIRRAIGPVHLTSHAQNSPRSLDCKKCFQTTSTFRLFSKGIFFLLCCFGNLFMIIKFTIII